MRNSGTKVFPLLVSLALFSLIANAQIRPTAPLTGTVVDPSGAVVPGASVAVKNLGTGAQFEAVTAGNGTFVVPALQAGTYSVTVTATGFKRAVVDGVKLEAAVPATVNVTLEIGAAAQTIEVVGGATPLQTQTANITTTIVGRQIIELPFVSRDALDLVLVMPGTQTPGRPRTSSINGLPKSSINITLDGVNVQDNVLKSSDGFFTYIRPRIDAIDEVTVSTSTPGAESSSEGAVQIKFVTRAGTNVFHGSVYEYLRNPSLNANYWFNNRDLPYDPHTGGAPKQRILLNQYGFRLGGPILKDRVFFFVNYEEYRLPEAYARQRTIFSPTTASGVFQYNTASGVQTVNLLALAAANGQTAAIDPTIGSLLQAIQASTSKGGVAPTGDPNLQMFSFINRGGQNRYFPTVRLDFNLTQKHHLENIWNYQAFRSKVDFLNGADPAFPGFQNYGSQSSNRFSDAIALRSTLKPTLVNEARFGLSGGTVVFFPEVSPGQFAHQGGYALNMNAAGIDNAWTVNSPQRRHTPIYQFNDTVTWTRGTHMPNFGFNFTHVMYWGSYPSDGAVRTVGLGMAAEDPAVGMFVPANFPGASTDDLTNAQNIYAILAGRVTDISGTAAVDEKTGKYVPYGAFVERARQREMGIFAQDSWRFRSNLTLNYGLRWEVQFPFRALNKSYAKTTLSGLYGVSGLGNLFKPGTLAGQPTQFTLFQPYTDQAYNTNWNNFAPSLGFAWSPDWKNETLARIFGSKGKSVIRAGYSIAYNREDLNVVSSILGSNPGGYYPASRSVGQGNLTAGTLLSGGLPGPPSIPDAPDFPITGTLADSANAFVPNLKIGYVQSWNFSLQREITPNTVIEARYMGNHGVKLWRQFPLNERNVIENGFLDEFKLAQANLLANYAAGHGTTFKYFGPGTDTSPLPIILANFQGLSSAAAGNPANYTSSYFKSSSFWRLLIPDRPNIVGFVNNLLLPGFRANAETAGLPANFFVVNPGVDNSYVVDNGGASSYNALVLELRRRISQGLLVQASYTFGKALTNEWGSSSTDYYPYRTLRQPSLNKTLSPWDIRHGFKVNWIYELPIGRGKKFASGAGGVLDRVVGGWEIHGTARTNTGAPLNFGNVMLAGMTREQLQSMIGLDKEPTQVYYLPESVRMNTRRAFNTGIAFTGQAPSLGFPTGSYIAPPNGNNQINAYTGEYGLSNLMLHDLPFARFDISVVKRFKITERVNFELRGEFLNAFNNVDFMIGSPSSEASGVSNFSSSAFGRVTRGYQDLSTTNDPGGRMVQIVARVNF